MSETLWLAEVGVAVGKARRWGYVDRTGAFVIEPKYVSAEPFVEGLACVEPSEDRYGFIDARGEVRIAAEYAQVNGSFEGGRVPVKLGRKWGHIDRDGNVVVEPKFQWASRFSEGLAAVELSGSKHGYIGESGAFVIAAREEFYQAGTFSEGLAYVSDADGHWRYIRRDGEYAFARKFDWAGQFSGGRAVVVSKNKCGYIDGSGDFVIEPRFGYAGPFVDGVALAAEPKRGLPANLSKWTFHGDRWGFIDTEGSWVVEPRFESAHELSEGLAAVCAGGQWGYLDRRGEMKIEPRFHRASSFSGGLAAFEADDLYGYIDANGRVVVPPTFWRAGAFARVELLVAARAGQPRKAKTTKPAKPRSKAAKKAEPEPIGTVASINASLVTILTDAKVGVSWRGIDGRSDGVEGDDDQDQDTRRAFEALGGSPGAEIAVGEGSAFVLDLEQGNGIAHVFRPEKERVVLVEGFISDADPSFTPWAAAAPRADACAIGEVRVASGVLALIESCGGGDEVEAAIGVIGAAGFAKAGDGLVVAVPKGTYRVLIEIEQKGPWGSGRRCHVVKAS